MAKILPDATNSSHYRFPAQGHSYIEIPHEAFHSQGECARALWGGTQPRLFLRGPQPLEAVSGHPAWALPVGLTCACGRGSVLGTPSASWEAPEMFTYKLTPSPLQPKTRTGVQAGNLVSHSSSG